MLPSWWSDDLLDGIGELIRKNVDKVTNLIPGISIVAITTGIARIFLGLLNIRLLTAPLLTSEGA